MASERSEKEEIVPKIEHPESPDEVKEIYAIPKGLPSVKTRDLKGFVKIYPLSWWRRWWNPWWYCQPKMNCCCCCGHHSGGGAQSEDTSPPLTINLSLGTHAYGGSLYYLITIQGTRVLIMLEWVASGGVGQLTVDLDVLEPYATTYRRLASGLGPTDSYDYGIAVLGATYAFRATVTDSTGQSVFDTETVTVP